MRTCLTRWEYNEISQGEEKNEDLGHRRVEPSEFLFLNIAD